MGQSKTTHQFPHWCDPETIREVAKFLDAEAAAALKLKGKAGADSNCGAFAYILTRTSRELRTRARKMEEDNRGRDLRSMRGAGRQE